MELISHRGLDPLNKSFQYAESSKEAFENLLERGYGLEFDINFSKDLVPFVFHDNGLTRISNGKDNRLFMDMDRNEIEEYKLPYNCHFTSLENLFQLIGEKQKEGIVSSLHLKSQYQSKELLDILIKLIQSYLKIVEKLFIFDIKIDTAKYLKDALPNINLFFSVSHEYDKKRFNDPVGGTLYTIEEAIENKNLINGVLLDEWDRKDRDGTKKLYKEEIVNHFKNLGFKTAIISPELHAKSPGLLGGESHEDANMEERLNKRIEEIKLLGVDYICTDYLNYYNKND